MAQVPMKSVFFGLVVIVVMYPQNEVMELFITHSLYIIVTPIVCVCAIECECVIVYLCLFFAFYKFYVTTFGPDEDRKG